MRAPAPSPTHSYAPEDDGATTLRDQHTAKYEARLQNSQARASASYDAGCRDPDPVAATGAGLLRGAGNGYLLHPDQVSHPGWLLTRWTAHGSTTSRELIG